MHILMKIALILLSISVFGYSLSFLSYALSGKHWDVMCADMGCAIIGFLMGFGIVYCAWVII